MIHIFCRKSYFIRRFDDNYFMLFCGCLNHRIISLDYLFIFNTADGLGLQHSLEKRAPRELT